MSDLAEAAAAAIIALRPGFAPRIALILGSGLGRIAERIEDGSAISYGEFFLGLTAGHPCTYPQPE